MAPRKHNKQYLSGLWIVLVCAMITTPVWAQSRKQGRQAASANRNTQSASSTRTSTPQASRRPTPVRRSTPTARSVPKTQSRNVVQKPATQRTTQRTQSRQVAPVSPRSQVRTRTPVRQQRVVSKPQQSQVARRSVVRGPVRVETRQTNPSRSTTRSQTIVRQPQIRTETRSPVRIQSPTSRSITSHRNASITRDRSRVVVQPQVKPSTRQPVSRVAPLNRSVTARATHQSRPQPQRAPRVIEPSRRHIVTKPTPQPGPGTSAGRQRLHARTHPPEVRVNSDFRRRQHLTFPWRRRVRPQVAYWDRPQIRHGHNYVYSYRDRWSRKHQCVVTPRYCIDLRYRWGHRRYRRHFYPFYHRKYVFVSLGGCWPVGPLSLRYYWYGWHPYEWYGYNPVAYQLDGTTNNYYTYNYYDAEGTSSTVMLQTSGDEILDNAAPPESQSPADVHFEIAVKAFEQGDYTLAQAHLQQAMVLDRNDIILSFANVQALFAQGNYTQASDALRELYARDDWPHDSVYYPRGLYADDEELYKQIGELLDLAEAVPNNTDLQLLVGYHLLGVGELDSAMEPLMEARQDPRNIPAVDALLDVLVKIQEEVEE